MNIHCHDHSPIHYNFLFICWIYKQLLPGKNIWIVSWKKWLQCFCVFSLNYNQFWECWFPWSSFRGRILLGFFFYFKVHTLFQKNKLTCKKLHRSFSETQQRQKLWPLKASQGVCLIKVIAYVPQSEWLFKAGLTECYNYRRNAPKYHHMQIEICLPYLPLIEKAKCYTDRHMKNTERDWITVLWRVLIK